MIYPLQFKWPVDVNSSKNIFKSVFFIYYLSSVTPEPQEVINPFGDVNDWGEEEKPLEAEGAPVRALYDYSKAEEDELSFKAGMDTFSTISEFLIQLSQIHKSWGRLVLLMGHL